MFKCLKCHAPSQGVCVMAVSCVPSSKDKMQAEWQTDNLRSTWETGGYIKWENNEPWSAKTELRLGAGEGESVALNSLCLLPWDYCIFIIIIRSWQEARQPVTHLPEVRLLSPLCDSETWLAMAPWRAVLTVLQQTFPHLKSSIIYV